MRQADAARVRANRRNGSTTIGLALARCTSDGAEPFRDGLWLAGGYRPRWPLGAAFTVGDVVLARAPREHLVSHDLEDPRLLDHERRHAEQWACWGGLPFLLAYGTAALTSLISHGDWWSGNRFERAAGLADGGYVARPRRRGGRVPHMAQRFSLLG